MLLNDNELISSRSFVIKPRWTIPPESTAIHGITQEFAQEYGVDLEYVMNEFISTRYDILIAHNLNFDENVLVNAIYWDLGRKTFNEFPERKRCSMIASTDMCKLPGRYSGYKPPKLSELHFHLFGYMPEGQLHNSMYDTEILVKCLLSSKELRDRMRLVAPDRVINNESSTKKITSLIL
jgi:DNA polymerase-3 subunit alpha